MIDIRDLLFDRIAQNALKVSLRLADRTGLEPATSGVTGRHSNQLNYRSATYLKCPDLFRTLQFGPLLVANELVTATVKVVGGTGVEPVTYGL